MADAAETLKVGASTSRPRRSGSQITRYESPSDPQKRGLDGVIAAFVQTFVMEPLIYS